MTTLITAAEGNAEDGEEMYKERIIKRTCKAIVLLIKPFVLRRSRCRCRWRCADVLRPQSLFSAAINTQQHREGHREDTVEDTGKGGTEEEEAKKRQLLAQMSTEG